MNEVKIIVRGEAVALARPRFAIIKGKNGQSFPHVYNPSHVAKYQSFVRQMAQQAMEGRPPLEGPLRAEFIIVQPIPQSWSKRKVAQAMCGSVRPTGRPDLSNLIKNAEDGLLGIVYRDDSQIVAIHATKCYGTTPQMQIRVSQLLASQETEDSGSLFDQKS